MFARLGMLQTVAIGAVVVAVGGWALYTQTDLFKPTPVVQAGDTPLAVAGETEEEATPVVTEPVTEAEPVAEETPTEETAEVDTSPEPAAEEITEETASVTAEETAVETVAEEVSTTAEAVVEEIITPDAPAFDVVRVESDGTTVVAGTGPAGWMISILVDDQIVETVEADSTGQFVAFLDLGTSDQARVMTLSAKNGDEILVSSAQILIAPVVQIAEATPETEPVVESAPAEEASDDESTTKVADAAIDNMFESDADAAEEAPVEEAVTEEAPVEVDEAEEAPVEVAEAETAEGSEDTTEVEVAEGETPVTEDVASPEETPVADAETVQDAPVETESSDEEVVATEEAEDVVETAEEATDTDAVEEADSEAETADVSDTATAASATEAVEAEPTAPAVLLVEDNAVTVLQPANASPDVLDELSISAISYSDQGAVQLSGFSPAGFLRVYLNNVQITVLEVPQPGSWSAELVDVAPGVYTLRIDQVDDQGNVQQRVETPFQREEPEKVVEAKQTRRPLVTSQVVQPGSTLWAISRENYGSGVLFVRIFEANKDQIRDPDLIYPGQIFDLPAPPGARKTR